MNNITDEIHELLDNKQATVSRQWLDDAMVRYPSSPLPLLLYIQHNKDTDDDSVEFREKLLGKLALMCPDRVALFDAIGEDASRFADFYPPRQVPAKPDTDTTITSFLDRFGNNDAKEIEALNQIIFNPTPDYSTILAAEEEKSVPTEAEISGENVDEKDALINRFIAQSKEKMGHFPAKVVDNPVSATSKPETEAAPLADPVKKKIEPTDDSTFSESLAKIYIKQGKYAKALEIIKNISLKFPEKSIYFADQMRFLKKLILNEQINNKK